MANNSSNVTLSQETTERSMTQIAICALALFLIILISIVSNMALFIAIFTNNRLKEQTSNMFIFNLCLSDLGNAIFVMIPSFTSLVGNDWVMGSLMCDFNCAFNYCFIIVSMMTLAGISIDRYISVMYSLQYATIMTRAKTKWIIAYIWIQALVFSMVPIILRWINYDYWEVVCAIDWTHDKVIYYVIAAFILCFALPASIMSVNYLRIVRTVRKNIQDAEKSSGTMQAVILRANKQAAKVINSLLVVVALFFISMTPFCVTKLLKVVYSTTIIPGPLNLLSSWVQFCGSAVNPLVYGIFRKDFRRAFRIIWLKSTCRDNMVASTSTVYSMGEKMMQQNLKKKATVLEVKPCSSLQQTTNGCSVKQLANI